MLQNAYFFAKIGADKAENEQHFAEILPTDALPNEHRRPAVRRRSSAQAPDGAVRAVPAEPGLGPPRLAPNSSERWPNSGRFPHVAKS